MRDTYGGSFESPLPPGPHRARPLDRDSFFGRILHNPRDLREFYGPALGKGRHAFMFNYLAYDFPIRMLRLGKGRWFLPPPQSTGAKIQSWIIGGWAVATQSTFSPDVRRFACRR